MKIFFSDLDGTLLHPQTYSYEPAQPALDAVARTGAPLVFCTSKTRAEVEIWRRRLHNQDPFIVENGGAIYIPAGYFGAPVPGAASRGDYEVVEFGTPYVELVETLRSASRESGCEVLGFHDMDAAGISARTLLPARQAAMAKRREYDEPFEILRGGTFDLLNAIESHGKRWTRGDRFYHITGANDKLTAVRCLRALYESAYGTVFTVGIGDGHNDIAFLSSVDLPVIVQSRFAVALKKSIPHGWVTKAPGPHGWNEAVTQIVGN